MDKLPIPIFSRNNAYWQPLQIAGVPPEYTPQLTAQDWAYATTWELNRFFLQPKLCLLIRRFSQPIWNYTIYISLYNSWRDEIRRLRALKAAPFSKETKT